MSKCQQTEFRAIAEAVARYYGVTVGDLTGLRRLSEVAYPRQILATLLRTAYGWSYSAIGRVLNRDHTTVMYSVRLITRERATDPGLQADYDRLIQLSARALIVAGAATTPVEARSAGLCILNTHSEG